MDKEQADDEQQCKTEEQGDFVLRMVFVVEI